MTATDELCRENERLRQQVASIIGRSFRTADKMDCLERENAKLRELVRRMFYAVHPLDRAQFLVSVAELGVEVDG